MIYQFEVEIIKKSKFIIQSIKNLKNKLQKIEDKEIDVFASIDGLIKESIKIKNSLKFMDLNEEVFFDKIEKILLKVKNKNANPLSVKLIINVLQNIVGYLEEKIDKVIFLEENDFYPLELWEDWRKLCYLLDEQPKPIDLFFPFAEYDEYEEDFFGGNISLENLNKYIEHIEDYEKSINVEEAHSSLKFLYGDLESFSLMRIKSGFQGLFLALQGRIILALNNESEFSNKKDLTNVLKKSINEIEQMENKENVSMDLIKNILEKFLILKNWKHLKEIEKINELNNRFNIEKFIFKTKLVNNQFFKEDRNELYKNLESLTKIINLGIHLLILKNKFEDAGLIHLINENHKKLLSFKKHFKYLSDNFYEKDPSLIQYKLIEKILKRNFQVNNEVWEELEKFSKNQDEYDLNVSVFKEDREVKLKDEIVEKTILEKYEDFLKQLNNVENKQSNNEKQEKIEVQQVNEKELIHSGNKEQSEKFDEKENNKIQNSDSELVKKSSFSVKVVDEKHLINNEKENDKDDLNVKYLTEQEMNEDLKQLQEQSNVVYERVEDKVEIITDIQKPIEQLEQKELVDGVNEEHQALTNDENILLHDSESLKPDVDRNNEEIISDEQIDKNIMNVFDENEDEDNDFYLSPFEFNLDLIIKTLKQFESKISLNVDQENIKTQSLLISNLNGIVMDIQNYLER